MGADLVRLVAGAVAGRPPCGTLSLDDELDSPQSPG
jgi:hypothetical protein